MNYWNICFIKCTSPPLTISEHFTCLLLTVLSMTPKTCLPFIFILSSLPSVCPFVFCPPYCMHSLTHSLTHSHTCSIPRSLPHSPTHPFIGSHKHALAAQPLRVVTEDTCLFHYLVPAPMSPSNKSVGSDAGSQDSGDGNAGPRSVFV